MVYISNSIKFGLFVQESRNCVHSESNFKVQRLIANRRFYSKIQSFQIRFHRFQSSWLRSGWSNLGVGAYCRQDNYIETI